MTKKTKIYWFDHFVVEGVVLYRLSEDFKATRRDGMFKVKPADIELFHWEQFDSGVQVKVLESVHNLYAKNLPINEDNMKQEMEISDIAFAQYKSDIMSLASGIPKLDDKEREGPKVLILVGIPGSGKSTFANKLVSLDNRWTRVNQDEMGTRKVCETKMQEALKNKKNVVVDRCNFDIMQRHSFIKLACELGASKIIGLVLDISPEECKQRIFTRKDHPTIKEGSSEAFKIIDRFVDTFIKPVVVEGFSSIHFATSQTDIDDVLTKINRNSE